VRAFDRLPGGLTPFPRATVQQVASKRAAQRTNMRKTKPFFQELLDALATNGDPDLALLRDLSVAVEERKTREARSLAQKLVKTTSRSTEPLTFISNEFFYELLRRLLLLGMCDSMDLIMPWNQARFSSPEDDWAGVLESIQIPQPKLSSDQLNEAWQQFSAALPCVLAAFRKSHMVMPPYMFPTLYDILESGVKKLNRALEIIFQQLLDRAVVDLEKERASKRLRELQKKYSALKKVLNEHEEAAGKQKRGTVTTLEIGTTSILQSSSGRNHKYIDAFPPYAARSIAFSVYERNPDGLPVDRSERLDDTIERRGKQIAFYFDAYGEPVDPTANTTIEHLVRQKLIAARLGNHLKLGTNEDLIAFLVELFDVTARTAISDPTSTPDQAAFRTVITFLNHYLQTSTEHTKFNLTEDDPSYLERKYPRALTGSELHDCGVYAVRLAYVLLSVSQRLQKLEGISLKLDADFIILPVHVGLIITGANVDPVVSHNAQIFTFDSLSDWKTAWAANRPASDADPEDAADRELKFLEDLAAVLYIRDVDMPVLRKRVLAKGVPPTRKSIWTSYKHLVASYYRDLFSAKIDRSGQLFELDLRYLAVLREENRWRNKYIVPFWNSQCKGIWERYELALNANLAKAEPAYTAELEREIKAAEDRYDKDVMPQKNALSDDLQKHPEALGSKIRRAFAERFTGGAIRQTRILGPIGEVLTHIGEVKTGTIERDPKTNRLVPPRFARKGLELSRVPE
jgi:hypothetical protein